LMRIVVAAFDLCGGGRYSRDARIGRVFWVTQRKRGRHWPAP